VGPGRLVGFFVAGLVGGVAGCYSPVQELISAHVEPGGAIAASLDAGPTLTTKALADATSDPMVIDGTSAELVVGVVVGDDLSGMPGKTLLLANQPATLTVTATSRAQLTVHLGGKSCPATSAVVRLRPDGNGHLDGDFSGSGAGCQLAGTLTQVPIDR
jgi:hypothetical protein